MSNKVWVTWTDVERNNLSDKVRGLANSDDVSDLKHAFVKQRQGLNIDPAYVEVREPGKIDILDEEDELKKYFVGTKREIAGPGQSKKTALVLTLPSSSTRTNLRADSVHDETVRLSKPITERYRRVMEKANIKLDAPTWIEKPKLSRDIPTHTWLKGKEDSQENREKYMQYLRDNIVLPEGGKFFEGSGAAQLLGVNMEEYGIKISGNIDVVIAHSRHQSIVTTRQNMWAGIELKRSDNRSTKEINRQVTLQHLAASYLNPGTGILTVMTDLCSRWHFYWFSNEGARLMQYNATKAEAFFLIQHMREESSSDISTPAGFLDRGSWNRIAKPERLALRSANDNSDEDIDSENALTGSDNEGGASRSEGAPTQSKISSSGAKRSRGDSQEMHDEFLDYMDEEEHNEAVFQAIVKSSLPKMMYLPEVSDDRSPDQGPPKNIFLDLR